jgi:hypothetical protein
MGSDCLGALVYAALPSPRIGHTHYVKVNHRRFGNIHENVVGDGIERLQPKPRVEKQTAAVFCLALQQFPVGEFDADPNIFWCHVGKEFYFVVLLISFLLLHKENCFGFTERDHFFFTRCLALNAKFLR